MFNSPIKSILLAGVGKALARLCRCPGWPEPLLLAAGIRSKITCAGANVELDNPHSAQHSMFSSTINIHLSIGVCNVPKVKVINETRVICTT